MLFEMKRWLTVALLAAGCYRSPPPAPPAAPPPSRFEEPAAPSPRLRSMRAAPREQDRIAVVMTKLIEFADDMCACTDRACADGVTQEITRWSQEMAQEPEDVQPTDQQVEEMTRGMERLTKCMTTAMSVAGPPPPPAP
jgi:hypothetical protein